ncbi:MAG: hypothetical protein JW927_19435 [Deltaproteobacteria bacterium]|nr:hypothetical protein [Deltaproteobacteria bacterium]
MKKRGIFILIILIVIFNGNAFAHFGMVIPSKSMVMQGDARDVTFEISFSHPFEMAGMDMERPVKFEMIMNNEKTDLVPALNPSSTR